MKTTTLSVWVAALVCCAPFAQAQAPVERPFDPTSAEEISGQRDPHGEGSPTTSEILATGDYDLAPDPRARYSDEELAEMELCPGGKGCPVAGALAGAHGSIDEDPSPDGSGTR